MKEKHPVTKARKRRKRKLVEAYGGECVMCGYDKSMNALHFHHVDPATKLENPTKVISQWSVDKAKEELDKCILVCSNCHAELHEEKYDDTLRMPPPRPLIKYECKVCESEFYSVDTRRVTCSEDCARIKSRKVVVRPSKEELATLLETHSWVALGKMYGVSDNAVRKWFYK